MTDILTYQNILTFPPESPCISNTMLQYQALFMVCIQNVGGAVKLEPQFSKAVLIRRIPEVCSVAYPTLFIRCRDYVYIRLTSHLIISGDHLLTHRSQFYYRNVVAKLLALLT